MIKAAALLLVLLGTAHATHLAFDGDWEKTWIQSDDPKYSGKFAVEVPKGLSKPALKVREAAAAALGLVAAMGGAPRGPSAPPQRPDRWLPPPLRR